MNENLKKNKEPMTELVPFRMTKDQADNLKAFCDKREWNMSAFIRKAIEESMIKVISEGR